MCLHKKGLLILNQLSCPLGKLTLGTSLQETRLITISLLMRQKPTSLPAFFLSLLLALCFHVCCVAQNSNPQSNVKQFPSSEYYLSNSLLADGQIEQAAAGYRDSLRNSYRVGTTRFVDSIPALVMAGECFYQQGNLTAALQQYESAMMLAIDSSGWSQRINMTGPAGSPGGATAPQFKGISWATNTRGTKVVMFPDKVPCVLGQLNPQAAVQQGGVVIPPAVVRLDVGEVLRTLAIAQRRRTFILGPHTARDPLSAQLLTALQAEPGCGTPWIDVGFVINLALAEQASGEDAQASKRLAGAHSTPDLLDHPLTAISLLSHSDLLLRDGDYPAAYRMLLEASLVSAQLEQYTLLSDIVVRLGGIASSQLDKTALPTLQAIATWTRKNSRLANAYTLAATSEVAIRTGNIAAGDTLAKSAITTVRSRGVFLPRVISMANYADSLAEYARGRLSNGQTTLQTATNFFRGTPQIGISSVLQLQIARTIELFRREQLTVEETKQLLDELLFGNSFLWMIEPLEALASFNSDRTEALLLWKELSYRRGGKEEIPTIADRIARERFYDALPYRHRLLAVRQLYCRSIDDLADKQQKLRKQLDNRWPELSQESTNLQALLKELKSQAISWDRSVHPKNELLQWKELETRSLALESRFQQLAISRGSIPEFLLGHLELKEIQEQLGDKQAIVQYVSLPDAKGEHLEAIVITRTSITNFELEPSASITPRLAKLLTAIGLGKDPKRKMDLEDFSLWQQAALELREALITEPMRQSLEAFDHVVIIPEDWLWYVPWNILPSSDSKGPRWSEETQLAIAPMLGLSLHCFGATSIREAQEEAAPKGVAPPAWEGAIWNLKFFGGADDAEEEKRLKEMEQILPGLVALPTSKTILPLNLWRNRPAMLLASVRSSPSKDILSRNWLIQDKASLALNFRDSLLTPLSLPEVLLLPGWTSTASDLVISNGDDLFLPATAMLVSGVRQGLLNRWASPGGASQRLLKRYLGEWLDNQPADAWQRSLNAMWAEQFDPQQEEILKDAEIGKILIPGNHPLIWGGYLQVGRWLPSAPPQEDAPP
jgi:tetratricopeptide (TPR) repeat protein